MGVVNLLAGLVLLLAGRRLFWLFVGCIGFAAGFNYAGYLVHAPSPAMQFLSGIALGALGAVLALLLQSVAIALAGFLAGAHISATLVQFFTVPGPDTLWIVMLGGGIFGAILLFAVFGWALVFLSSLAGAALVAQFPALPPSLRPPVFVALALFGILLQGSMKIREERSKSA